MKTCRFHIYIIGIFLVNFYAGQSFAQLTEQTKFTGKAKMVDVEPSNVITTEVDGDYKVLPYRDRRPSWGKTISIGYSNYEPVNYEPNFLQANFNDIYTSPDVPLMELQFTFKRNSGSFSYGAEIGVGVYQNNSDQPALIESTLQMFPIKFGGVLLFDALSPQPYFAPYLSAGGYMVIYKEDNNSTSINGNTQVAPYITAGIAFSLDWIDRHAARVSYEDSGIEASYAYIEARSMFQASNSADPDFSSPVNFGAGIKVEF